MRRSWKGAEKGSLGGAGTPRARPAPVQTYLSRAAQAEWDHQELEGGGKGGGRGNPLMHLLHLLILA